MYLHQSLKNMRRYLIPKKKKKNNKLRKSIQLKTWKIGEKIAEKLEKCVLNVRASYRYHVTATKDTAANWSFIERIGGRETWPPIPGAYKPQPGDRDRNELYNRFVARISFEARGPSLSFRSLLTFDLIRVFLSVSSGSIIGTWHACPVPSNTTITTARWKFRKVTRS